MPKPLRPLTPGLSPAHRLGAELREFRNRRGHSQKSLGDVVHVSKSMIGAIEVGDRISTAAVIKACDDELGANGALCELWRAAAPSRRHVGRPPKSMFDSGPIDVTHSGGGPTLDRVLEHVERALALRISRASAVHGRTSIGAATNRGTWIRLRQARADEVNPQEWGGAEAAASLKDVAAPQWIRTLTWRGETAGDVWRADEHELVESSPVEASPDITADPRLSSAWWSRWNTSMDALSNGCTALPDPSSRQLVTAQYVAQVIEAVWPGRTDTSIGEWTHAHGGMTWRKLTAPTCWILDWDGYGLAPRGLDAATLWSNSLVVPEVAARIWHDRRADLESATGMLMAQFCLARILGSSRTQNDPLYKSAGTKASLLLEGNPRVA